MVEFLVCGHVAELGHHTLVVDIGLTKTAPVLVYLVQGLHPFKSISKPTKQCAEVFSDGGQVRK